MKIILIGIRTSMLPIQRRYKTTTVLDRIKIKAINKPNWRPTSQSA
jgi:hypothetical protein